MFVPVTLCLTILNIDFLKSWIWGTFFIAVFGIIIIVLNTGRLRKSFLLSLFLSILYTYLCFFISLAILSPIIYILKIFFDINLKMDIGFISLNINKCFFLLSFGVISPLLTYFFYSLLFTFNRDRFFYVIAILTMVILTIIGLFTDVYNTTNYSIPIIWQPIMLFALQLILYRDKIKL